MGIYREPVRSSHGHLVKVSGLRWLSLTLLTLILSRRDTATTAWCRKQHSTFSGTLAVVRCEGWREQDVVSSARALNTRNSGQAYAAALT